MKINTQIPAATITAPLFNVKATEIKKGYILPNFELPPNCYMVVKWIPKNGIIAGLINLFSKRPLIQSFFNNNGTSQWQHFVKWHDTWSFTPHVILFRQKSTETIQLDYYFNDGGLSKKLSYVIYISYAINDSAKLLIQSETCSPNDNLKERLKRALTKIIDNQLMYNSNPSMVLDIQLDETLLNEIISLFGVSITGVRIQYFN